MTGHDAELVLSHARQIVVGGKPLLRNVARHYFAVNKPKGYLCASSAASDAVGARKLVIDLFTVRPTLLWLQMYMHLMKSVNFAFALIIQMLIALVWVGQRQQPCASARSGKGGFVRLCNRRNGLKMCGGERTRACPRHACSRSAAWTLRLLASCLSPTTVHSPR